MFPALLLAEALYYSGSAAVIFDASCEAIAHITSHHRNTQESEGCCESCLQRAHVDSKHVYQ